VWPAATAEDIAPLLRRALTEAEILEVLIGLPTTLSGEQGLAAENVRGIARALKAAFPEVAFRLVDERLTTAAARKQLQSSGYTTRTDRSLIDAAAAAVLLEDALEAERRQGNAPGELVV
jgi:putative Holliday junction resolvase